MRLLLRPVFSVFVAMPVFVFNHPAVCHVWGDTGVRAHRQEWGTTGSEESFLPEQLVFLLMVLGRVE